MVTLPDDDWHASMQDGPDPSQLLEDRGLTGTIEAAITTLPPTFRTAVVLCDVQGMTYEEIADATGWPLGTVRSRIHRGRRMLRTALAELDPSGSETSVVAADTTGHEHTEA
jgi:RNA polymerase sigma-70 factor (ECF subfamily)